jgi:hypothetical protein
VALVEARAQEREAAFHPGARGLDGHAEPGRDLARGQALEVAQHDRGAVRLVERDRLDVARATRAR